MSQCRTLLMTGFLLIVMVVNAGEGAPSIGDPVRGKALYAQCMGCHSPDRHRTGPKHCGLMGRKVGTAQGYDYSKAMQEVDFVWNTQTLDRFLYAPLDFIPGTTMGLAGIKKEDDRRDLIAHLVAINKQIECN